MSLIILILLAKSELSIDQPITSPPPSPAPAAHADADTFFVLIWACPKIVANVAMSPWFFTRKRVARLCRKV